MLGGVFFSVESDTVMRRSATRKRFCRTMRVRNFLIPLPFLEGQEATGIQPTSLCTKRIGDRSYPKRRFRADPTLVLALVPEY